VDESFCILIGSAALEEDVSLDTDAQPIRCSANVAFLFPHRGLIAALEAAAEAGFHTVELLDPYGIRPVELGSALERLDLRVDLMNLPLGDFAAGDRGFAGDPGRRAEFGRAVRLAEDIAERIAPSKVNVLAGRAVSGVPMVEQLDCLRENLDFVATRFQPSGIKVVTELLNPIETPEFLLPDVWTMNALLESLDGRVGFQLDIYHLQRAGGELIPTIQALAERTWHVQVADAPGRSEPGTGEINIPNVLRAIQDAGYHGIVGLEYTPTGTDDPFAWMPEAVCVPA
jgi:hydroxypyruvate isomerase